MDYSLLWLDWKPKEVLPAYTKCITGMPATRQGKAALRELVSGLQAMGAEPEVRGGQASSVPSIHLKEYLGKDDKVTLRRSGDGMELAGSGTSLLYGVFHLLRHLATGEEFPQWESAPAYPIRMLDHWDNADGSIERGYAGLSFFFRDGKPVCTERTRDYARLLASCGLNGCCINNVNVHGNALKLLTGSYKRELKRIALCLAEYGVSLWLCVSFSAPMELGGLDTADPLDGEVKRWWKETSLHLFTAIPNLAGFLIKADSEGRHVWLTSSAARSCGAASLTTAPRTGGTRKQTGPGPNATTLRRWTGSSGITFTCKSKTALWIFRSGNRYLPFWAAWSTPQVCWNSRSPRSTPVSSGMSAI